MDIQRGSRPSMLVGGFTTDWNPAVNPNDILLWAQATDGTTNPYHTARKANATAGYQVPTGKALIVLGMDLVTTAAYAAQWGLAYGDTDVGLTSAAAPTNAVTHNNGTAVVVVPATAGSRGERAGPFFSIPAGKYPDFRSAGSSSDRSSVQCYCRLIDA